MASPRQIPLHRQVCTIGAGSIHVHPSRAAVLFPLTGFLLGALAMALVALGRESLPFGPLAFLLLVGLLLLPLAGVGLVYALVGARVIFDRAKGSATWQQGFLGLGIGTKELVPFAKIGEIALEEVDVGPGQRPVEEVAQWEILLVKQSGKRLSVGTVAVPRFMEGEGLARAREVAEAIAALTGRPLRLPQGGTPREGPQEHPTSRHLGTRGPRQAWAGRARRARGRRAGTPTR